MSATPVAGAGPPPRAPTPYAAGALNPADLATLIRGGEDSFVEFKRDDITPEALASVLVGFLNMDGGRVLLGVEDDGAVSGLRRDGRKAEEWALAAARTHVQPAAIPLWQNIPWDERRTVGVVSVPAGAPDKPYKAKRASAWVTRVRVGTMTRDASREEEQRLYQQSGYLSYGAKPALGAVVGLLDRRRLREYCTRILRGDAPESDDDADWVELLTSLGLATASAGEVLATVTGVLLFGKEPKRLLPQSGIRALCFPGPEMDYAARDDQVLAGPLVALRAEDGSTIEPGLVERGLEFVRRNTKPTASLDGGRRVDRWEYPEAVVREAIVNGLVHRDYSIAGTDLDLLLFSDRLEVRSPGNLPNTVTIDGMRRGKRYARDQVLVHVMRDYGYADARGMGVRNKIIPGMRAHNGTEPDLIAEDHRFTVRLWKDAPAG